MAEYILRSFRLKDDDYEYLKDNAANGSANATFNKALQYYRNVRTLSMQELKGIFTSDEWKFFASSLNGLLIDDGMRYRADILVTHNQDAELMDGTATEFNIDLKTLNTKVLRLSAANIDAIYTRVENYWNAVTRPDFDEWAKFQ